MWEDQEAIDPTHSEAVVDSDSVVEASLPLLKLF